MLKIGFPRIFEKERQDRANYFMERSNLHTGGGILFLGDSITASYPIEEYFQTQYVINRGISGDTIENLLARLESGVIPLNPSKIFLLIGTNDLGNDLLLPTEILVQYDELLFTLTKKLPNTTIYVESVIPINPGIKALLAKRMTKTRKNSDICLINDGLSAICEKYNCIYIDTSPSMSDDSGLLKIAYTIEGLHLSTKGYQALSDHIRPYLLDKLQ